MYPLLSYDVTAVLSVGVVVGDLRPEMRMLMEELPKEPVRWRMEGEEPGVQVPLKDRKDWQDSEEGMRKEGAKLI